MKNKTTEEPKIAKWVLSLLSKYEDEFISCGDLSEGFKEIAKERGSFIANLWYWAQVLYAIPSYCKHQVEWSVIMIRNYLKIAFRNFRKHKVYAFINISGLVLGIAASLCLIQLIRYELSYDGFHEDADRIYRIVDRGSSRTQASLADALEEMFPEVEQAGRVMFFQGFIRINDALIQNQRIYFADPEIMDIFSFPSTHGYDRKSLADPFSVLITQQAAEKYFRAENPVGKIFSFANQLDFHVKGILDDIPENTHFRFDFIAPISNLKTIIGEDFLTGWGSREFFTYFRLAENANASRLSDKFPALKEKYGLERPEYRLQPLKKIHVGGNLQADMGVNTDTKYLTLLGIIVVFLLLMAFLNYINLSTAQASKRLKEIGLRKVIGSKRGDIIRQFMAEALLTAMIAIVLSVFMLHVLFPEINHFWDRTLSFNVFQDSIAALLLLGVPLAVGLIAGFFPAFRLSSFSPSMMAKGKLSKQGKGRLRTGLIVFQFLITIFLLIGSLIVDDQLQYLKKGSSNAYGESIVIMELTDSRIRRNHIPFKNALQSHPAVWEATASFNLPFRITTGSWCSWPGQADNERFVIRHSCVEHNFIDFYKISLVEGRNFSKLLTTDQSNAVLINQTAARLLGGKDVVGRTVSSSLFQNATVVGILEDFHFKPLHQRVEPLALTMLQDNGRFAGVNYLAVKLDPDRIPEVLAYLDKTWKDFSPEYPLTYDFLDDHIEAMYRQEIKVGNGIRILTIIEIFLACLGLFGLSLFTAEQRTKEIGVRKVLGASTPGLVWMLLRELTRWIGFAAVIAFPLAWYVMRQWLQNFEYHTEIAWPSFAISTLLVLLVSIITLGYHSIRAAKANPVESFRYE